MAVLCAHNVRKLILYEMQREFHAYKNEVQFSWPRTLPVESIDITGEEEVDESTIFLHIQNRKFLNKYFNQPNLLRLMRFLFSI